MGTNVTLDSNCIVALEKDEPTACWIRELIRLNQDKKVNLRVVAISASERKRDQTYASSFAEFEERITQVGLHGVEILKPIGRWGITYWDWCLWADDRMLELERRIHEILFPEIDFSYKEFCKRKGLDINSGQVDRRWRNAKCDVLALWSHIWYGGGIFVTDDGNFHKQDNKPRLASLGAGEILRTEEAVTKLLDHS